MGWISSLFLPSPTEIITSIWQMTVDGDLLINIRDSVARLTGGFLLGALAGGLVALLMIAFEPVARALNPIVDGLYAVPKAAFLPIIIIWLGIGETAKVSLIATGSFFPVLINLHHGAKDVPPVLLRAARNLGASRWQVLFRVVLPAVLPELFAGLKLGVGVSLTLTVYAEMIGVGSGIGFVTQNQAQLFQMADAYGALVVLIVIAFVSQKILLLVQNRACRWQAARNVVQSE
jgi:ABC-type nitrate/sulfonate/bicarbonate transport system permease component